jgi:hypothetical protein
MSLKIILFTSFLGAAVIVGFAALNPALFQDQLERQIIRSPTGELLVCKHAIITMTPSSTAATLSFALQSVNGTIASAISNLNTYDVLLPGRCDYNTLNQDLDTLRSMPGVENVDSDRVATSD